MSHLFWKVISPDTVWAWIDDTRFFTVTSPLDSEEVQLWYESLTSAKAQMVGTYIEGTAAMAAAQSLSDDLTLSEEV